jgi:hypothetical protein
MNNTMIKAVVALLGLTNIAGALALGGTGPKINVNVNAKVAVGTCPRGNCPVTINAVGDKAVIDISKYAVTDLGTIVEAKDHVSISLPTQAGDMKIYSFIPTEGDLANKKIFVAFDNQQPRAGSRFAGLNLVKVHRRANGETDWTEAGQFAGADKVSEWQFEIRPNGDFVTIDPRSKKVVTFELGAGELRKS